MYVRNHCNALVFQRPEYHDYLSEVSRGHAGIVPAAMRQRIQLGCIAVLLAAVSLGRIAHGAVDTDALPGRALKQFGKTVSTYCMPGLSGQCERHGAVTLISSLFVIAWKVFCLGGSCLSEN